MKRGIPYYKVLAFLIILPVVLSGCSIKKRPASGGVDTAATPGAKVEASPTPKAQDSEYEKLSDNEKEQYNKIKASIDNNQVYNILFPTEKAVEGEIKYDLNKDGKMDTLKYSTEVIKDSAECVTKCRLDVNGFTLESGTQGEFGAEGLQCIGVFDADKNDNYVNFYITDGYLYGGNAIVYRLADDRIDMTDIILGGVLGTSGDGKIYYWGGNLFETEKFNPDLVITYYDVNKKDFIDTDQIVGKTITAEFEFILYKSKEDVIDGPPVTDEEKVQMSQGKIVKMIKSGDTFKVLSVTDGIKVMTSDGKVGWIGGFHMVWS